jgi:hypothetical protein
MSQISRLFDKKEGVIPGREVNYGPDYYSNLKLKLQQEHEGWRRPRLPLVLHHSLDDDPVTPGLIGESVNNTTRSKEEAKDDLLEASGYSDNELIPVTQMGKHDWNTKPKILKSAKHMGKHYLSAKPKLLKSATHMGKHYWNTKPKLLTSFAKTESSLGK